MLEHFFANNLVPLGIIFLIIMFLSGKFSRTLVRAIVVVILAIIVLSVIMGVMQEGTRMASSLTPGNILMWIVGKFGGAGGAQISTLNSAGDDMQTRYRACLYTAVQHDKLTPQLKAQCPDATPLRPDAQWEQCLSSALISDPYSVAECQRDFQGPAGLTHSTVDQTGICRWFPSWCSAPK